MVYPDTIRFPRGLYGITPDWSGPYRDLLEAVEAAASGGMVALQWRQKHLNPADQLPRAHEMAQLCKALGILFIVNDSIDLALRSDADGVHLGRDDDQLDTARQLLGPEKILGCSCYNQLELAYRALQADVDYLAFGSVYPSGVKPDAVRASTGLLQEAHSLLAALPAPRPALVAIGGITPGNAKPVIHAGADSLAVISSLFSATDITGQARRFSDQFSLA